MNLVGALIDDDYSNDSNAVVVPHFPRECHTALKVGLDFRSRMQIGLDMVEGRFLLSQLGATAQRYQTEECPGELTDVM